MTEGAALLLKAKKYLASAQEFAQKNVLDPRFHRLLISAFEKRQQADYLAETGLDRAEVTEMLTGIETFVHAAETWLSTRPS